MFTKNIDNLESTAILLILEIKVGREKNLFKPSLRWMPMNQWWHVSLPYFAATNNFPKLLLIAKILHHLGYETL